MVSTGIVFSSVAVLFPNAVKPFLLLLSSSKDFVLCRSCGYSLLLWCIQQYVLIRVVGHGGGFQMMQPSV